MGNNKSRSNIRSKHVSVLLVEGETEEEFYKYLAKKKFQNISKKIINLKGNFNINNKIIDSAFRYNQNHPNNTFDVYVCIDQEKIGVPAFNKILVEAEIKKIEKFKRLFPVVAVLMMESLFFIDIDGIYKFLRAKKTLRKPKQFSNFRKLRHQDLSRLFKQFGKQYYKGVRCRGFVENLDIDLIQSKAREINKMVASIQKKA